MVTTMPRITKPLTETEVKNAKPKEKEYRLSDGQGLFEVKKDSVTPDYATDIWRSLKLHIFAHLADMPIKNITAPLVIELLKPIEAKGSLETVKRLSQRLNEVMNFITNCGLIQANPLTGIKAAFKKPKKENMAALKPTELPAIALPCCVYFLTDNTA